MKWGEENGEYCVLQRDYNSKNGVNTDLLFDVKNITTVNIKSC